MSDKLDYLFIKTMVNLLKTVDRFKCFLQNFLLYLDKLIENFLLH